MTKHLRDELDRLKRELLALGSLVEENLNRAFRAWNECNEPLAQQVISNDRRIDETEVEIEEKCLQVMALHQPVATDLRFLVAVLKINNDLERIGDLAANIARTAKNLAGRTDMDLPVDFTTMQEHTRLMVKEALDALITMDTTVARKVLESDRIVDKINYENFHLISDAISKDPAKTREMIRCLNTSKHLERIADYATNIAEDVIDRKSVV